MGADNSVFNVTLKAIMDIGDVKHNVDALQNSFKKLKLPDKIGDNLQKNISNFMKEYDKYQNKLAQGIQTQGDQRAVNKSLNSMLNSYEKIINEFDNLSKKDFKDIFNLDEGAFKKVQSTIKQMQAEIKKVKLDPKQLTEPMEQISKLTKANAVFGSGKGFDKIKLGFDDNNIEKAKEGLADIDKYLERFRSQMSDNKYKGIQEALDPIREHVAQAERETQKFTGTLDRAEKELQDLGAAGTKGLKNTADALKKSGQAAEKLTDTLKRQHEEEFNFNRQAQDIDRQIQSYFGLTQMIRKVGDIAREAFNTVKELDAAMVQTAVVTNFDVGDMWNMLPTYTEQANQLGATIKDVYEAATLYYQQGLNTNQAMGLANETLKMARIAGLDAADATNMMTAALRGFNMEINQTSAQKINDIYSELAAITASDTKEIGSAMERTASIANSANMDFATTSAFLAQMIETTREAPENLGTAMKTIVARFQEMKQDPTKLVDSEGVAMDANKVDAALKTIGVNLTNTRGEFRNLDEVFLDISAKWDSLTQGQQRYIATIAAGSRQQSRFIAMMSDYDRTMELVDAANNSAGASQKQFEKTLDSMSTKLNQLKNAWDQFTMGLMNNQIIKFGIDALTEGFTIINKFIDLLGNLPPSPFEGITKSILTLVTTLGMLNFGKRASRGLVMGGVGWWKGEKSFTQGFGEGYQESKQSRLFSSNSTKAQEQAGEKDAKAYKSGWNKIFAKGVQAQNTKGNIGVNVLKESFGINQFKKNLSNMRGNDAIIAQLFPEQKFSAQAKKDIDAYLNTLRAELKTNKITKQEAEVKLSLRVASQKGGMMPGLTKTPAVSKDIIDALATDKKIKTIGTGFTGLASKIDGAGASLMNFGMLLQGTPLQPFGTLLSTVGMALTTFGGALGSLKAGFLEAWAGATAAAMGTEAEGVAAMQAAAANGTLTASEIMAAGGAATLKAAFFELFIPLAAIAAIIGVAVFAFKKIDEAIVTNKEKLENATDAAAKASEAYDSAKQETSELADAISQIQDNDNAFDNLVAGTAEFNEKLVEANQKITELINKYPMLNDPKYLSTDENGLMHITQAGLDYVKEYQKQRQNNAAALSAIQTAQLNSEENRQKASKLKQGDIFGTETEESYKKRLQEAEYLEKSAEAAEKVAQQTAISSSLASDEIKNREKISAIYAGQYDDLVKQVDTTKMGIEEMRQAYADFYGYTYNKSTKEMTDVEGNVVLTKDDDQVIKDAIPDITVLTNFEANASSLDNMIDSIDQKFAKGLGDSLKDSGNLLTDILSDNIETNEDALKELIQDPGKITEGIQKLNEKEIAALLNISQEEVENDPEKFSKILENRVQKEATNIADAQSKSYEDLAAMMAQTTYGTIEHATNYAGGGWITSQINRLTAEQAHTMSNIGTTLRDNVGPEAMSAFIEDATDIYTNAGQKTIDKFNTIIGEVNWESATSRLEGYNKAIDSSNERIQEWGHSMRNSTEEANILGESFNEFVEGDWLELSENADDFKNAMGEIDAAGILKAAESSKTLKSLLDSGEVSASGVATALQGIEEGQYSIGAVNTNVLLLLSNMNKLADVATEAHNIIQNFDAGIDTGEGDDFVAENAKAAKEYYENGELGNEQLQNYIKLAAGTDKWNTTLQKYHGNLQKTEDELMKYVTTFEEGFQPAWDQMISGEGINGKSLSDNVKQAVKEGRIDESLTEAFNNVKVRWDDNGLMQIDVGDLTTSELTTYFQEVYGVSEEYAKLLMQDLANYDATLASRLQANDIQELAKTGELRQDRNGNLIFTDEELRMLKAAGVNLEELAEAAGTTKDKLKKTRFDVLDKNGNRKDALSGDLLRDYAEIFQSGKHSIKSLFGQEQFLTDSGSFDLKKLMTDTVSAGMDEEQSIQSAYKAWKVAQKEGQETSYNGQKLDLAEDASIEDFKEAINQITETSQWVTVGQAIAQGIIGYINGGTPNNPNNPNAGEEGATPSTPSTDYTTNVEEGQSALAEEKFKSTEGAAKKVKEIWDGFVKAMTEPPEKSDPKAIERRTKKHVGEHSKAATKAAVEGADEGGAKGAEEAKTGKAEKATKKKTKEIVEKSDKKGSEGASSAKTKEPKTSQSQTTKETTTKKDSGEKTTVESKEEVTVTYKANTDELDLAKEKIQSTIKAAEEGAVLTVTAKTGGTFKTVGESISNFKESAKGSVEVGSKVTGTKSVKELTSAISKVKSKSVNVKAEVSGITAVVNLKTSIDNLKDKDIYVTTHKKTQNDPYTGGLISDHGVLYRAKGGPAYVMRPKGTDTVPAMLTPGEYVQNRSAVKYFGIDFMRKINHKDLAGALQTFGSAASGRYGRLGPKGKGGLTLTGETGFEIAWLPSESRSMILGAGGPQMVNLPSDAVVYTHKQSKEILKRKSVPAGSHNRMRKNSGDSGSADDSGSSGGSSKKSKPKKGGGSKLIIKSIKLVDKAGKITNWWENISRRVDGAQRQVDKALKNFNKVVNIAGTNFKTVSTNANTYIKKLNLSKSLNQQIVDKYTKSLKQLDKGTGKQSKRNSIAKKYNNAADKVAKAEAKVETVKGKNAKKSAKKQLKQAKKQLKNATKSVNKSPSIQVVSWKDTAIVTTKKGGKIKKVKKQVTRQKAIDYSKLIKYDAATDTYILDDKKINKLYGSNKKTAKAVKEKGNKLIDEKIQRRNTAQDKIDDAREALDKLADDVYNMFNRWEKSLTEVYLISQQIATLQGKKNIYDSQEEYMSSKLLTGYSNTTDGLAKLTQVLENRRKNLVETAKANSDLIEGSYKNYAAALDFNQYREQFMVGQKQGNSATAETELAAATIAFKILREAGATSTDTYDPAKVEKAYQNYVKQNYTNETDNEVKKVLDRIQDYQSSYYEAITDTYGSVTEIYSTLNEYRDYINDFEESLLKGMEEELNKEIDQLSKINSALTDGFKNLLDEVKTRLNERRQTEDNQKTETDISKKQQRLAALQADTSGGHAVEIAQLQREIADAQQNYGRTLEDQLLDKLQKQGDEAAKQRERQIKLLEIQRDLAQATGTNLEEVKKLLEDPIANMDKLRELWLSDNNFDEALPGQQEKLLHEFEEAITKYLAYSTEVGTLEQVLSKVNSTDAYQNQVVTSVQAIEDILKGLISNGIADPGITTTSLKSFKDAKMSMRQTVDAANAEGIEWNYKDLKNVGYKVKDFKDSGYDVTAVAKAGFGYNDIISGGFTYNDILRQAGELSSINPQLVAKAQKAQKAEETARELARIKQIEKEELKNAKNNYKNNKDNEKITTIDDGSAANKYYNFLLARGNKYDTGDKNWNKLGKDGYLAQVKRGQKLGYSEYKVASDLAATSAFTWEEILKVVAAAGRKGKIVKAWNPNAKVDSGFRKAFEKIYGKWNKFASGGLADQTGPAWLDGTPSKPELVLNAKDTKNFIALKDVLSHIMTSANNLYDSYGGNATYEININVDHLNNDYDVDKVAERVKKKIVQDSGYRNVTQVRKFR